MNPVTAVKKFLDNHSAPFLLALSGGADSLCLFYSFLECQKKRPFVFHVAHVDHGWREESRQEAETLKKLVASFGIPFHTKRLENLPEKGNLENLCRQERYAFFKEIVLKHQLKGVMTAHHADDHSETVLKRLFEGSHWSNLVGLKEEVEWDQLKIWRPLLGISKKKLVAWLLDNKYQWFEDQTNRDPQFLRSRMRSEILPYLNESFGKEVSSSLIHHSNEMKELDEYLDKKVKPCLDQIQKGKTDEWIELSLLASLEPVEIKYFLRKWLANKKVTFSRQQLEQIMETIQKRESSKRFIAGNHEISLNKTSLSLAQICSF